jgi:F-type H+-transporting ATPase subunit a
MLFSLNSPLEIFEIGWENSGNWLNIYTNLFYFTFKSNMFLEQTYLLLVFGFFFVVAFLTIPDLLGLTDNFLNGEEEEEIADVREWIIESHERLVFSMILNGSGIFSFFHPFFIFIIFDFIFLSNFFGLIPMDQAATSHFVVTWFLATVGFLAINLVGIYKYRFLFFSLFLPNNTPLAIAPLLIMIELISYIARDFSLSIRLFANIMSGHTLLKICLSFVWVFLVSYISIIAVIPLGIIFFITILEFAMSFLQAYVFCLLLCFYIKDILNVFNH